MTARFDSRHTEIEAILRRKLARWAHDNFATLQACDPPMPPTAYNRVADNWRPLFAIAHTVGGDWPALVLESYNLLAAHRKLRPALDSFGEGASSSSSSNSTIRNPQSQTRVPPS